MGTKVQNYSRGRNSEKGHPRYRINREQLEHLRDAQRPRAALTGFLLDPGHLHDVRHSWPSPCSHSMPPIACSFDIFPMQTGFLLRTLLFGLLSGKMLIRRGPQVLCRDCCLYVNQPVGKGIQQGWLHPPSFPTFASIIPRFKVG